MALILVQNKVCAACGADVRPNALFCYFCGSAVSVEEKTSAPVVDEKPDRAVVSENETVDETNAVREIAAPKETFPAEGSEKTMVAEEVKLKSAAALRRKSKSFQNKPVEVVWEEHENAPNGWFISVAVFLTLVAVTVLYLAIRLK